MYLPKDHIQPGIQYKGLDICWGVGECLSRAIEAAQRVTNVTNLG